MYFNDYTTVFTRRFLSEHYIFFVAIYVHRISKREKIQPNMHFTSETVKIYRGKKYILWDS